MQASPSYLISKLRQSAVFREVPEEQLQWLIDKGSLLNLKEGSYLFQQGDPVDRMVILLKGRLSYEQKQNGISRTLNYVEAGEVTGALPYSRASTAITRAKAQEDSKALCLHQRFFREMIRDQHELTEVLVHSMTSRVREFTHLQQQLDKMAALGKLSAGLAHELNNPAAAIARSSAALNNKLASIPEMLEKVSRTGTESLHYLQHLSSTKTAGKALSLNLLDKTSLEDEQVAWLEKQKITHPYSLAETFIDFNVSIAELDDLVKKVKPAHPGPALECLSQLLNMKKLAGEIQESSGRMSELVKAVKTYAFLDQSPDKKEVNLLDGIQNTLSILNFKLKKKNIQLQIQFPEDLPKICAYQAELNQLWTNLIDNAIDAMGKDGKLKIAASLEEQKLKIQIEDNGQGVPEEIKQQVFDPFFTTKPMEKGSGLGLDTSKRIVDHHKGEIKLESETGKTVFTVYLPL